ncbi:MAG: hypothetical protein AAGN82_11820 [Myxococcota bacterium]
MRPIFLAVLCLLGCGCHDDPAPPPEPAASAPPPPVTSFCDDLCARTTSCGVELARVDTNAADAGVIADLEASLPAQRRACRAQCARDPEHDENMSFQRERARVCLRKSSCEELDACFAAL